MSVIIRLQNLPWSANALDIRQFFQGLSIPEGGVHIVGGEQGDAFIAFSTDEDARQAMMHNGGKLKETQVSLLLSSRTEMQKVIDTARQKVLGMQAASVTPPVTATPIIPAVQPVPQPTIPAIANIAAPHLTQQMGLPIQAQLPVQQRLLGMLGMGMAAAQLNNLPLGNAQQTSLPLGNVAAHSNNPLMHPHLPMQQQQHPMMPQHQAVNPMMQAQMNHMRPNNNQVHQQQQQLQQQHHHQQQQQQQQQQQVNERAGRDARPDRRRSRSRSRERRRSRDRRDRSGGNTRRRRSRSRSRERDKTRRRDRSKSRERSREHTRDGRDRRRDDRKSSRDDKTPRISKDDIGTTPKNAQQAPTPWVNPSAPAAAPGMMNMPRFPNFQPNSNNKAQQGDVPVWGQQQQQQQPFNAPQMQQSQSNQQSNGSGGPTMGVRRPAQNTCVKVSSMPQTVVYRDLREFFQHLHVLNIKLITDEKGQKQGKALIKFGSTECKLKALTMNGTMYDNTQRVEVKHCTEEEYDRTLDSYTPNQEPAVVAINNIPPYANEMDVKRVFHGARIFNVVLMHPGDKKEIPSGFVQFSSMSERNRAVAASGKLKIDNQEIYVTESSFEDIFRAQKAVSSITESVPKPKEEVPAAVATPVVSECVLLKGLPPTTNNREILDFFSDVGLIPLHIFIMQDDKGAPAGDAFCEFRNPAEGVRAVAKNKTTLGTKEITVRPVVRHEMEMALGMAKNPNQMMGPRNGQEQMRHQMRPNFMNMNRPQFDPRNPQMFPMRGPFPRGPFPPHMMGNRPRPPFMNGPPQEPNIEFGKPGCVVEVTNVPYQADIDEILSFFSDFELTRQDVIRRFNDMGKPTGDLRIAFHSPPDAQRAMSLKFKKMRDRQIYMNLLQT